ncbi:MAG: hypothetical protein R2744_06170 [Bacteroidales bacterium]
MGPRFMILVDWSFSYEKVGENEYDIIFNATIEEHSHLYSMRPA